MLARRSLQVAVAIWISLFAAEAGAQLQSVDEALAISKKTGRPIFAMAGQKT
jgi:hypothetical protein